METEPISPIQQLEACHILGANMRHHAPKTLKQHGWTAPRGAIPSAAAAATGRQCTLRALPGLSPSLWHSGIQHRQPPHFCILAAESGVEQLQSQLCETQTFPGCRAANDSSPISKGQCCLAQRILAHIARLGSMGGLMTGDQWRFTWFRCSGSNCDGHALILIFENI